VHTPAAAVFFLAGAGAGLASLSLIVLRSSSARSIYVMTRAWMISFDFGFFSHLSATRNISKAR
jgi:hypothetical protein